MGGWDESTGRWRGGWGELWKGVSGICWKGCNRSMEMFIIDEWEVMGGSDGGWCRRFVAVVGRILLVRLLGLC